MPPLTEDSDAEMDKESLRSEILSKSQPQNSPVSANFNEFFANEGDNKSLLSSAETPKINQA